MGTTIFVRCRTVKDRGSMVHSTGVLLANRLLSPFSEWLGSLWVQRVLWYNTCSSDTFVADLNTNSNVHTFHHREEVCIISLL